MELYLSSALALLAMRIKVHDRAPQLETASKTIAVGFRILNLEDDILDSELSSLQD